MHGTVEYTVGLLHSNSHSTTHSTWSIPWSSTVELRQRVNLAPTPCKRASRLHGVDGIHRDGDIFMCAPEHTDMADLIRQASTPPS